MEEQKNEVSILPLGGVGTVTRNMYVYEYKDEILIVDCGIGFTHEGIPGVDLQIPDITYLKNTKKKIVGMVLSHGHEDHIGAIPFIIPSLPNKFPMYASTMTAALANEKLQDFGIPQQVTTVRFGDKIQIGSFNVEFLRITHSILDASHMFIKTPAGNFYHGADFKIDHTPIDGNTSDLERIVELSKEGILCTLSDALGAERPGTTGSEMSIYQSFEDEFRKTKGKIFVTTFASNISRLNQAIEVGLKLNRKFCLLGRSLVKARDIGKKLGYMKYPPHMEIKPSEIRNTNPSQVMILLTGSQAQEFSALVRVANGESKDVRISPGDTVIFSADPIPGNEAAIHELVDLLSKRGAKVVYADTNDRFHVSGHGSQEELKLLIALTKPRYLFPIGATFRQMVAYKDIAETMGYKEKDVVLIDSGQQVIFNKDNLKYGQRIKISNVYVDDITGGELDNYIIHDRMKISKEGIVVVIVDLDPETGELRDKPDVITRGFVYSKMNDFIARLNNELRKAFEPRGDQPIKMSFARRQIQQKAEQILYKEGREPLVIPVILEV